MNSLSKNLFRIMKDSGMSVNRLSMIVTSGGLRCSERWLDKLMRDPWAKPSFRLVEALAGALSVTIGELCDEPGSKPKFRNWLFGFGRMK